KRLVVPSRSVEPGFKILLYPHLHGDPLPEIELSDHELKIIWPEHEDVFALQTDDTGRTHVIREAQQNN
ncbi:MAG: hypothetical protein AAGA25_16770, partial [Planctomycetota bacterium]